MKIQHIAMAVCVSIIWGLNFVIVKVGLAEFPPFIYGMGRFVVSMLPIVFVLHRRPTSWKMIGSIGMTLGFLKFALMFTGIQMGMSAGLASLILQSQVFFTVILSMIFFKSRLTLGQIVGVIMAFTGVSIIALEMHSQSTFIGFVLLVLAAISWAVSNILYKKAGNVDMFVLTIWTSLVPPLPMLGCHLLFDDITFGWSDIANVTMDGWLCLIYTACGSTWIGATLWGVLLKNYDAAKVAPFSLLIPVFGISSAWLFLGEQLSLMIF
jgi:O-acetylserine/cysteine efflux transporter